MRASKAWARPDLHKDLVDALLQLLKSGGSGIALLAHRLPLREELVHRREPHRLQVNGDTLRHVEMPKLIAGEAIGLLVL